MCELKLLIWGIMEVEYEEEKRFGAGGRREGEYINGGG
jgi:hypothetical protein